MRGNKKKQKKKEGGRKYSKCSAYSFILYLDSQNCQSTLILQAFGLGQPVIG
jgi:hypothetical protein